MAWIGSYRAHLAREESRNKTAIPLKNRKVIITYSTVGLRLIGSHAYPKKPSQPSHPSHLFTCGPSCSYNGSRPSTIGRSPPPRHLPFSTTDTETQRLFCCSDLAYLC